MDNLQKKLEISADYYNNLIKNKDNPFSYIAFLKGVEYAIKSILAYVEHQHQHQHQHHLVQMRNTTVLKR